MTDVTQAPAVAEPSETELEANMAEFFGHRLADPIEDEAPAQEPTPVAEQSATPPVSLNPSPAPAPNAEPAASQNEGGDTEIDAGLMAEVMLGAAPAPVETPAAPVAETPAATPPSSGEQLYMPIKAETIRIPQAQLDSIFRSEDPVEQERALTNLMAGWMNAGLAMMDQRMKEHYVPQISQQAHQVTVSAQRAQEVENDFFSTYPDLRAAPQLVQRVGAYFSKQNPNAKWGPELKAQIGDNARKLARQMGIKLEGAPQATPPAPVPFVADSARPSSAHPTGQPDYSPGKMVEELSFFA